MDKSPEGFSFGTAVEEALKEITLGQRELLEDPHFRGFEFRAKSIKPGHTQWMAGFIEYVEKEAGNDPARIKAVLQDFLERQVRHLKRNPPKDADGKVDAHAQEKIEAQEKFLEKLLEAVGGHKSEAQKQENEGSLDGIFNKKGLKDSVGEIWQNIRDQLYAVLGWVGNAVGIKNSLGENWKKHRTDMNAAKMDDARKKIAKWRGEHEARKNGKAKTLDSEAAKTTAETTPTLPAQSDTPPVQEAKPAPSIIDEYPIVGAPEPKHSADTPAPSVSIPSDSIPDIVHSTQAKVSPSRTSQDTPAQLN